jgi:hypothetical protein
LPYHPAVDAIERFWVWWAGRSADLAAAFSAGRLPDEMIEEIRTRVAEIDPRLDWEFGRGRGSEHHLCVSGDGDPELRVVAERWRRRGPHPDATWQFYAARQAADVAGCSLSFEGHEIDLDSLRCGAEIDTAVERMHIAVHHPALAAIDDRVLALRITLIALDNALGEDDVERWIGSIDVVAKEPSGAFLLADLPARVARLSRESTGDRWAILQGEREGRPIVNFQVAEGGRAPAIFDRWRRGVRGRSVEIASAPDPGWATQKRWVRE